MLCAYIGLFMLISHEHFHVNPSLTLMQTTSKRNSLVRGSAEKGTMLATSADVSLLHKSVPATTPLLLMTGWSKIRKRVFPHDTQEKC